ncbi:unnamed protein product, partial [marine sediment metagenome]
TTAQTLGFMKAKFIDKARALKELEQIGYDTEHMDIYMRSVE